MANPKAARPAKGIFGKNKKLQYDPNAIQKFVQARRRQALINMFLYPVYGGFLGILIADVYVDMQFNGHFDLLLFFIGAVMGYSDARVKANQLKLEVQTALCVARIEENTRK
jgi:hypothetical protein